MVIKDTAVDILTIHCSPRLTHLIYSKDNFQVQNCVNTEIFNLTKFSMIFIHVPDIPPLQLSVIQPVVIRNLELEHRLLLPNTRG